MITTIILCHPQSADLINNIALKDTAAHFIACGTTKCSRATLSEANDFFPTYASWNSILFESSVILTAWEHASDLIKTEQVAFLHTDIVANNAIPDIWTRVSEIISNNNSVGLTMPSTHIGLYNDFIVDSDAFTPRLDPMYINSFGNGIMVWEFIKKYDLDIYEWAMDIQPRLIYSHQFACSIDVFTELGAKLYEIIHRLRLEDCGLWTPHMLERMIALYLAKLNNPILTCAFWHHSSSGVAGPGTHSLYGPRPFRYYRAYPRYTQLNAIVHQ